MEGKPLGDLTATANTIPNTTANTTGTALRYDITSDFAGSTMRINGQTDLNGDHRTTASAAISNLPMDRVLAIAGRARSAAHRHAWRHRRRSPELCKTRKPTANVTIANGSAYQEAIYPLAGRLQLYRMRRSTCRVSIWKTAPRSSMRAFHSRTRRTILRMAMSGFHVNSNQIQLAGVNAPSNSLSRRWAA